MGCVCCCMKLDTMEAWKAYEAYDADLRAAVLQRLTHPFCVVCMDADANMSFVHGNTAHLACCEACAQKFMVRHDSDTDDDDIPIYRTKCPVCRQGIDSIVKQF